MLYVFKLLKKEKGNTTFTQQIWNLRPKAANVQEAIDKTSTGDVQKIATLFNNQKVLFQPIGPDLRLMAATTWVRKYLNVKIVNDTKGRVRAHSMRNSALPKFRKAWLTSVKIFNRFVQSIRRANLTIDTARSIATKTIQT